MLTTQLKLIISGISFLVIFAAGFWLHNSGKPYNMAIFTLHKLVSLGLIILLAITISKMHQASPLNTIEIITLAVTGFLFAATIGTGGMLSVDKVWPPIVSTLHKVLPFLALASTSASMYLLLIKFPR
jgi:hypothetical protein